MNWLSAKGSLPRAPARERELLSLVNKVLPEVTLKHDSNLKGGPRCPVCQKRGNRRILPTKHEISIWEKANLTIEEAAVYFGIGMNKLQQLTEDEQCKFVLFVGTKDRSFGQERANAGSAQCHQGWI